MRWNRRWVWLLARDWIAAEAEVWGQVSVVLWVRDEVRDWVGGLSVRDEVRDWVVGLSVRDEVRDWVVGLSVRDEAWDWVVVAAALEACNKIPLSLCGTLCARHRRHTEVHTNESFLHLRHTHTGHHLADKPVQTHSFR